MLRDCSSAILHLNYFRSPIPFLRPPLCLLFPMLAGRYGLFVLRARTPSTRVSADGPASTRFKEGDDGSLKMQQVRTRDLHAPQAPKYATPLVQLWHWVVPDTKYFFAAAVVPWRLINLLLIVFMNFHVSGRVFVLAQGRVKGVVFLIGYAWSPLGIIILTSISYFFSPARAQT